MLFLPIVYLHALVGVHIFFWGRPNKKRPPQKKIRTPPKINIEPENDALEDDVPFPVVYSQVPC